MTSVAGVDVPVPTGFSVVLVTSCFVVVVTSVVTTGCGPSLVVDFVVFTASVVVTSVDFGGVSVLDSVLLTIGVVETVVVVTVTTFEVVLSPVDGVSVLVGTVVDTTVSVVVSTRAGVVFPRLVGTCIVSVNVPKLVFSVTCPIEVTVTLVVTPGSEVDDIAAVVVDEDTVVDTGVVVVDICGAAIEKQPST